MREPAARRFVLAVIGGFLVASLGNVFVEVTDGPARSAIRSHESGDLSHLVETELRSVRIRYNFEASLRDIVGSGTLVVPDAELVDVYEVRNLARMRVEVADYDPVADADMAARLGAIGTVRNGALRTDGEDQTLVIVAPEPATAESRYRLLLSGDVALVVDEDVLSEMDL